MKIETWSVQQQSLCEGRLRKLLRGDLVAVTIVPARQQLPRRSRKTRTGDPSSMRSLRHIRAFLFEPQISLTPIKVVSESLSVCPAGSCERDYREEGKVRHDANPLAKFEISIRLGTAACPREGVSPLLRVHAFVLLDSRTLVTVARSNGSTSLADRVLAINLLEPLTPFLPFIQSVNLVPSNSQWSRGVRLRQGGEESLQVDLSQPILPSKSVSRSSPPSLARPLSTLDTRFRH